MILNLDKHGGVPIYRQVIDQIKSQIMTGQLVEGVQLESVANLSGRLKVNPMTISKAFGYLVQEGLLERRAGVGVFVNRIKADTRDREKKAMLSEAMKTVVDLAKQMDMREDEVIKLMRNQFKRVHNMGHDDE